MPLEFALPPGDNFHVSLFQEKTIQSAQWLRYRINETCESYAIEPWLLIVLSAIGLLVVQWLWEFIFEGEGMVFI